MNKFEKLAGNGRRSEEQGRTCCCCCCWAERNDSFDSTNLYKELAIRERKFRIIIIFLFYSIRIFVIILRRPSYLERGYRRLIARTPPLEREKKVKEGGERIVLDLKREAKQRAN